MKKYLWLVLALALGGLAYGTAQFNSWGKDHQQISVFSVLVVAVVLWVSEALPLYVTSLLASFFLIVVSGFSPKVVLSPYFDPVIVLFLGGFLLARAMQKYQLDYFAAQVLLSRMGTRPIYFLLGMMLFTAFLSLWMSNTASAALMIPIAVFILSENKLFDGDKNSKFGKAMVLGVAYSATLGGIGSLVGSPPNAIAVSFLRERGVEITFVDWMIKTVPFVLIAIIYTWLVLIWLNPPEIKKIVFKKKDFKVNRNQLWTIGIFVLTVIGWMTTKLTGLSSSTVALLTIILLFVFDVLDDQDLRHISWGTLLLFGGGLSLGNALTAVGAGEGIVVLVNEYLIGTPVFLTVLGFIVFGVLLTMVASNTAAAAILIPLVLPLADPLGVSPEMIAILIAMGVSLDFMIPVGTPPSAIAHSTGLIKVSEMVKNGILINTGTALILAFIFYMFYL